MGTKSKIFLAVVALATSAAVGRWSAPEKIKEVVKTVEVEKKSDQTSSNTDRDRHKKTVITETIYPDGRKETKTVITDDIETKRQTDSKSEDEVAKNTDSEREVTKSGSRLSISALAGTKLSFDATPPVFGGMISKEVLGPISIGVWGLSNGTAGASIGLSF